MKRLAVFLAVAFVFSCLPAFAGVAQADSVRSATADSNCRAKRKAKKQAADSKSKKKGKKDDKKPYGFEL